MEHDLTERAKRGLARFRRRQPLAAPSNATHPDEGSAQAAQIHAAAQTDQQTQRVMVVEDSPTFREQLGAALGLLGKTDVASFANGTDALDYLHRAEGAAIGLALVDIGLPDMNGIEIIRHIRGRLPEVPILVISVIKSEQSLLQAIRAGANGYVVKDESEEAIATAIGDVLLGNYPISPSLARTLFQLAGSPQNGAAQAQDAENGGFKLAPREVQVLHLIARGLTYLEVAAELSVSLSTIQTYVRGLYRKLGVHNRQSAVNKGRTNGLLQGRF